VTFGAKQYQVVPFEPEIVEREVTDWSGAVAIERSSGSWINSSGLATRSNLIRKNTPAKSVRNLRPYDLP
jgi:hypothetical protein